jgi:pimeloyl-ACP methyl ester carboxylesterase
VERHLLRYGLISQDATGDPAGARALVLDSPQFPQVDPVSGAAGDFGDALRALAETCRSSDACARAYPNLEGAFSEATSALDRSPRSAAVDGRVVLVDGAAMARVVRHLLSFNDWSRWGEIPRIVYRALDGNVKPVAEVLAADPGLCIGYLPRCIHPRSLGAYLSFTCPDVLASAGNLDSGAFGADDPYLSACDAWGSDASQGPAEPVVTDVPALMLRGEYDGFSPLDLLQQAPATMPNAHVVLVPYIGHDIFGTYDCLREARNSWLANPGTGPSYQECLTSIRPPTFT